MEGARGEEVIVAGVQNPDIKSARGSHDVSLEPMDKQGKAMTVPGTLKRHARQRIADCVVRLHVRHVPRATQKEHCQMQCSVLVDDG